MDWQYLIQQIAHQARIEQIAWSIREDHRAANATSLAEASATGHPARLYADPKTLAAECAAVKARSRATYGKHTQ